MRVAWKGRGGRRGRERGEQRQGEKSHGTSVTSGLMRSRFAAVLLLATACSSVEAAGAGSLEQKIEERLRGFPGTLGIAAVHLGTGETVAVNADVRFPTASVIKVPVMVTVFQQMAEGRVRPDQLLTLKEEEKVGGSGVLQSLRAGAQFSVSDLLYLMIAI